MHAAGQQQMRRLLAEEGDGLGGAHRRAHDRARGAVDAARQIDRQHRRAIGVDRLDHLARLALDRPAQARAEQRIDDQRRLADRLRRERQHRIFPAARGGGRIALQRVALAHQDHGNLAALRGELGRRDEAVAAIVAGPGNDHDRPLLDQFGGGFGDRLPRAQHQREARRAGGNRQPVGPLHLRGGQDFHARSCLANIARLSRTSETKGTPSLKFIGSSYRPLPIVPTPKEPQNSPHPEAFRPQNTRRDAQEDCTLLDLIAYFAGFAILSVFR